MVSIYTYFFPNHWEDMHIRAYSHFIFPCLEYTFAFFIAEICLNQEQKAETGKWSFVLYLVFGNGE